MPTKLDPEYLDRLERLHLAHMETIAALRDLLPMAEYGDGAYSDKERIEILTRAKSQVENWRAMWIVSPNP